MNEVLANRVLVIPVIVWLVAQLTKVLIALWIERKLNLELALTSGGMPSSHSGMVCSLATVVGSLQGVGSPLFGFAVVFAVVVMYDAAGVRRDVGTHARIINMILDQLLTRHQFDEQRLRELVGHTPLQVLLGAILGVTLSLCLLRVY